MDALRAWGSLPRLIRKAIRGLPARDLGRRGGSEAWSVRKYVHHLLEANVIAATIIIAALGKPGSVYDWSWVRPEGEWVRRLGYNRVAVEPALAFFEHLCRYVTLVVRAAPRGLRSPVRLKDTTAGTLTRKTVEQILRDEWEHAQHHLQDIAKARNATESKSA
ncbi:MAG: hypothetical protein WD944_12295 [Steroidobacteraceae bacterium]